MKVLIRKLKLVGLVLVLCVSFCACGEVAYDEITETTKRQETTKDDDKKNDKNNNKDKTEEKPEVSDEDNAGVKEEIPEVENVNSALSATEQQALASLVEDWRVYFAAVESGDAMASQSAKARIKNIDRTGCSKELRMIFDQAIYLVDEYDYLLEWAAELVRFEENTAILTQMASDFDLLNAKTLNEIVAEMINIDALVGKMRGMEFPQFMQGIMKRMDALYVKEYVVLYSFVEAQETNDYLGYESDKRFWEELLSEGESLSSEMEATLTEYLGHMETYEKEFNTYLNEFTANLSYVQSGMLDELSFTYLENDKKIEADINCTSVIYPAMYNSMDAVSILTLSCPQGEKDVLLTVEVVGFSQKYEQTLTVGRQPQRIYVKPPVLSTGINLDSQKETQIKVSLTELGTGNIVATESKTVKLMSINDFRTGYDEYGYTNFVDVLAWVTPESNYIRNLLQSAGQNLKAYTGVEGIYGYQKYLNVSEQLLTSLQVYAIQQAISQEGVRYVMSYYSIGEAQTGVQRVKRPDDTLLSKSGICIETAVLMASALQAAGFNSMIVFTPGHCQVAVETWDGSGDYILIETTALPVGNPSLEVKDGVIYADWNGVLTCKTDVEWAQYFNGCLKDEDDFVCVYECNMATQMGITPLTY